MILMHLSLAGGNRSFDKLEQAVIVAPYNKRSLQENMSIPNTEALYDI